MTPPPPIAPDASTIAVVCPSWVGDTVMATPVLRAVRLARPNARIVGVMRPGLDELLAGTSWLDATVVGETKTTPGMLSIARRLHDEHPDAALLLPNSFRSALLACIGGCRTRCGYRRYGRAPLLAHWLDPPGHGGPVPTLDYYVRLGRWALGVERIDTAMELAVTEAGRAQAAAALAPVARPFAVLCPGANKPPKRWPPERFAAVADALAKRGMGVVVTGAPAERGIAARIAAGAASPVHDFAGTLSIGALKAVIAEARLVITNDTGPRHIAAALGTPVIVLFGPTDHRWTTIDFPGEHRLTADPFLPPQLVADKEPRRCAITKIAVGDVLSATARLLDAPGSADLEAPPASPAPTTPG